MCLGWGGGGKIAPLYRLRLFKPNLVIRIWPVNISKFKYVHPGLFANILRSDKCLPHFDAFPIFDPLRPKKNTLQPKISGGRNARQNICPSPVSRL